jgi:hypothetical protein
MLIIEEGLRSYGRKLCSTKFTWCFHKQKVLYRLFICSIAMQSYNELNDDIQLIYLSIITEW